MHVKLQCVLESFIKLQELRDIQEKYTISLYIEKEATSEHN